MVVIHSARNHNIRAREAAKVEVLAVGLVVCLPARDQCRQRRVRPGRSKGLEQVILLRGFKKALQQLVVGELFPPGWQGKVRVVG